MKKILLGLFLLLVLLSVSASAATKATPMRFRIMDPTQKVVLLEGDMTALSFTDGVLLILTTNPMSYQTIKIKVDGVEREFTFLVRQK